ncbi:conserved hypothetical protein [Vibrio phage 424E50-1]|nr:conserved hypothetical protein [Vibrio phage 501E54-1]CAH9014733.1 conserved hypothetical protein [Vibrio phage 424E50-1]
MSLLMLNDKCQIVDVYTEAVYGSLFKRDCGEIYFRPSLYGTVATESEKQQIDKILKETNNA